jgi:hypothetical protein
MPGTPFLCCSDHRRAALEEKPALNGIDFLEVADLAPVELDADEAALYAALPAAERDRLLWQRRLTLTFVNPLLPAHLAVLTPAHLRLEGGERKESRHPGVAVLSTGTRTIVLRTTARGDFSTYRLRIVMSDDDPGPPPVIDPMLAAVDFSFKVECPSDFDCAVPRVCPPAPAPAIDVDYLARDYASFRKLLLDRISALSPAWRERHAADLGVALVELVAYVGDYLAYRQDAVATEAYLGTARRRVSVRRHARLVDYPMHDGCNARAWVQVVLRDDAPPAGVTLPRVDPATGVTTKFLTRVAAGRVLGPAEGADALARQHPETFEPLADATLYPQHNEIGFYTWGASDCCLPKGATRATLAGRLNRLAPGDVLILEEVRGPRTGVPGDADPAHRHAVRLTRVTLAEDPLGGRFRTPPTPDPVDVTGIEWSAADALPFPLCVSATVEKDGKDVPIAVSVARGNIVPADHGLSVVEPLPDAVPAPKILRPSAGSDPCGPHDREPIPARFTPALVQRPLTHAAPYDPSGSAASAMRWEIAEVLPRIHLESGAAKDRWSVRRDLLGSSETARDFVVEVEADGTASLRFGDGRHAARPVAGTLFTAFFRVGNGLRGNVGAGAIAHVVTIVAGIDHVRNPMSAAGGVDPEPVEDIRRFAPEAFRTQERAVTADDYARRAERHRQVQKAAATFRWTGSWRTVFVTADPFANKDEDAPFDPPLPAFLEPYRMAGHDLDLDAPRYVPLEVDMQVCARREYFRADVKRALLDVFSSRILADGTKGVFHPDNFTFGQPLYLSRLYAAAYAVKGVESAKISLFQRLGTPDAKPLADGRLDFARLEIARLDNDPSLPERGVFRLNVGGGK